MSFFEQITPLVSLVTQPCETLTCLHQLEQQFYQATRALGFPCARFSVVADRAASQQHKDVRHATSFIETLLFSINFDNFPVGFTQHYVAGQLWRGDNLLALVQQKMRSTLFTSWHAASQVYDIDQQHPSIQALAAQFDINSGILLSYWNGARQIIVSAGCSATNESLCARIAAEPLQQQFLTIVLSVNAVIDKISACDHCVVHARKPRVPDFALTRMQKAILLAYLNNPNASLLSISETQGISGETVKYHLKCIREKLAMPGASGHVLAHEARQISLL